VALYEELVAVTFRPDSLKSAFQRCATVASPGSANASVQFVIGEPEFVTARSAVKPPATKR
jgi:hypothetical protein